jgi:hypothetical protein
MSEDFATLRARFDADHARWLRSMARMRRITLIFLLPYACAGAVGVWGSAYVLQNYSRCIGVALLVSVVAIISFQWLMPYLTRRGDRKDSISTPDAGIVGSVVEVRDEASE